MKRITSIILSALLIIATLVPLGLQATAEDDTSYSVGDVIEFGSYPQGEVTSSSVLTALNKLSLNWQSYGYYSGTGTWHADGQMKPSDFMRYADVNYNGAKYRAVVFDSYRPGTTAGTLSIDDGYAQLNGYNVGVIYWFKYEPLRWRVLNTETGLVMCETIIDSQAFNNYILLDGTDPNGKEAYWGDADKTFYANNYEKSSIRQWLNNDFSDTAFSNDEKSNILCEAVENSAWNNSTTADYSFFDSETTYDRVFLLSAFERDPGVNGFTDTASLVASGSDYAKCQGLYVNSGLSPWSTRTALVSSDSIWMVGCDGSTFGVGVANYFDTAETTYGIRPAMKLSFVREKVSYAPVAVATRELPSATVGSVYSARFMNFDDAGYTHKLTICYQKDWFDTWQGGVEEIEQELPYTFNGLTFENDGTISGTPTKKENDDRPGNTGLSFGIKVQWFDSSGQEVSEKEFYGYYWNSAYFSLKFFDSSERISLPSDPVNVEFGKTVDLTSSLRWYKVKAVTDDLSLIPDTQDGSSGYCGTLYGSDGYPAFGGDYFYEENWTGDWGSHRVTPGETYYFQARGTTSMTVTDYYSLFWQIDWPFDFDETEEKITLIETGVHKSFDGVSNSLWNVYCLTGNCPETWEDSGYTSFMSGWSWYARYIYITSKVPVCFSMQSENSGNLTHLGDVLYTGAYSADEEYRDVSWLKSGEKAYYAAGFNVVKCMERVNGTSNTTLFIYVPDGCSVYNDGGKLRVNDGTEPVGIKASAGSVEGITASCLPSAFDNAVYLRAEKLNQASDDWQKYEFDMSLRIGDEKMQSIYLIRTVDEAGNVVQPKAGHTVTLQIPIPHGCNFEKCRVAHILDEAGTSESFKWDPAPGSLAKPFTISENGKFFIIEVSSFSPFIIFEEETATLKLRDTKKTLPYGERLLLTADVENLPEGAKIVWTADNGNVELKPSVDGKTCEISAKKNGNVKIAATIVDKDGKPIQQDGNVISVNVSLKAKATLFHKLFYWIFRIPWPFG